MTQPETGKKVAITGASGYIGSRLVDRALQDGHALIALGRRPLGREGVTDVSFDLVRPHVPFLPDDLDAVVHLAADTSRAGVVSPGCELRALEALCAAMPKLARLVFVSSQSARADAVSDYGRTKWAIEAAVTRIGGVSVRPGLVYGGPEQGLYGRLCNLVRNLPALPRFVWPRPITQPIHVDDLVEGLLRIALGDGHPGPIVELAQPQPMPFDDFLDELAWRRFGLRKAFVPVPLTVILPMVTLVGRASRRDIGAAQLGALAQTLVMDTAAHLEASRLILRPLAQGLEPLVRHRSPRLVARRARLDEGRRLLAYLLDGSPHRSLIARYARSLEAQSADALLDCRGSMARSSLALAILDRPGRGHRWEGELQDRLALALGIAEASPQSFERFIGEPTESPQRLRAASAVMAGITREGLVRLSRIIATGTARRFLQRHPALE